MKNEILQKLKAAKLKITPARSRILDIFLTNQKPLDAEFFSKALKIKGVNQVTVYRNLNLLLKAGVIKRLDLRKKSTYYELANIKHHHHMVCVCCGATEGFAVCEVEKITKKVLKNSLNFKKIDQHSLELFGVCKSCAKR